MTADGPAPLDAENDWCLTPAQLGRPPGGRNDAAYACRIGDELARPRGVRPSRVSAALGRRMAACLRSPNHMSSWHLQVCSSTLSRRSASAICSTKPGCWRYSRDRPLGPSLSLQAYWACGASALLPRSTCSAPPCPAFRSPIVFSLSARQLATGTSVIVDTCLAFAWLRNKLADIAADHHATMLVVNCVCSDHVARQRVAARTANDLPHRNLDEYDRLHQIFEDFGTAPALTVDTTTDLTALPEHVIATIHQQAHP